MSKIIALVTGGIGGIGSAICQRLSKDGHTVIASHLASMQSAADTFRNNLRDQNLDVVTVAGDVADFESTKAMMREIQNLYGAPQILVNCAGITKDITLKNMDLLHWESVINTNLSGVFHVTKLSIASMISRGFGRIVNITSVNGQKGQFGQTNYSASKAGIHGFTMALAQEVAAKGILVNSVAPGFVQTKMTDEIPEKFRTQMIGSIPIGRMATPQEVAHVVRFLCLEETTYITGACIPVNGGLYMS